MRTGIGPLGPYICSVDRIPTGMASSPCALEPRGQTDRG